MKMRTSELEEEVQGAKPKPISRREFIKKGLKGALAFALFPQGTGTYFPIEYGTPKKRFLLKGDNIYEITIERNDRFLDLLKYEKWTHKEHEFEPALERILEVLNHKKIELDAYFTGNKNDPLYVLKEGEKLVVPKLNSDKVLIESTGIDARFTVWGKYMYLDKVRRLSLKEVSDRIHRQGEFKINKEEKTYDR